MGECAKIRSGIFIVAPPASPPLVPIGSLLYFVEQEESIVGVDRWFDCRLNNLITKKIYLIQLKQSFQILGPS